MLIHVHSFKVILVNPALFKKVNSNEVHSYKNRITRVKVQLEILHANLFNDLTLSALVYTSETLATP